MAAFYWIKLYDEILDDPKMGRLSDGAYRLCINLFLLASRQELRDGRLPDFDDIGWLLRLSCDKLQELWQELERAEIVCMKDGLPFVSNFETRQEAVSDAERMRRYRERKRLEEMGQSDEDDTQELHDSDETVTKRNADKEIDRDKEVEKEKKTTPPQKPKKRKRKAAVLEFEIPEALDTPTFTAAWGDYITHRREIKKPLTNLAAKKQLKQLDEWGCQRAVVAINHSIAKGWQSIYEPKEYQNGTNGRPKSSRPVPAPASERTPGAY